MKTFLEQFRECAKEGFHKSGEVKKFKDHPELLPAPWHRAAKEVAQHLKEDPEFGLTPILCLRFGGECHGKHEQCMKFRGIAQELEQSADNR